LDDENQGVAYEESLHVYMHHDAIYAQIFWFQFVKHRSMIDIHHDTAWETPKRKFKFYEQSRHNL